MPKLLRAVVLLFVILLALTVAAAIAIFDNHSLVEKASHEQLANADSVNQLVRQLKISLVRQDSAQDLSLSKDQLDSLLGFAQRAFPPLSANLGLGINQAVLNGSYQLPDNSLASHVNFQLILVSSDQLEIASLRIGSLTLPGWLATKLGLWLAELKTQTDIVEQFMNNIRRVDIKPSRVHLKLDPMREVLTQLKDVKSGVHEGANEALRFATAYYMQQIQRSPMLNSSAKHSVAEYLQLLFKKAQLRSETSDPVLENQAVILAMAIYAGHYQVGNLVGDVQPNPNKALTPKARPLLAGRQDLTRHYFISAAIQVMAKQGVSYAVGEFKELMDRGRGGSGYSFVDLAADMAGVKLADIASSPEKARWVQQQLANATQESLFFPNIQGLPEGISKQQFKRVYSNLDSAKYKAEVERVNQRVLAVPLFKN